jgi:transcriptional regulator with XRE-family HTH domain
MLTTRHNPTIRRRRLGVELRRLREASGVTIERVADHLECSTSKISRIETGHTAARPRDVRDMLDIYRVSPAEVEELLQIAREARQKAWWHPYGAVLSGAYVGLEAAAESVHAYEAQSVPGLLQTEGYARAQIAAGRTDMVPRELERRVQVRMARQALLREDDPVKLWYVLDEAVLSRPVGGDAVMREQLVSLVGASDSPNVTIQVLPFEAGAHRGMEGTFAILHFADEADQNVVFSENATGGLFLEKEDELRKYERILEHICALALPPAESRAFLALLADEPYWTLRRHATGIERVTATG